MSEALQVAASDVSAPGAAHTMREFLGDQMHGWHGSTGLH